MNARNVIISSSLVLAALPMWAAPALPGFHRLTQPDGTVVEAQMRISIIMKQKQENGLWLIPKARCGRW